MEAIDTQVTETIDKPIGSMAVKTPGSEKIADEPIIDPVEKPTEGTEDTEEKKESDEFNFEEFEYEVEQTYELSDYGFEEEDIKGLQPSLDKFKTAGITQDQLKIILEEVMANDADEPQVSVRERLETELSKDELSRYKTSIPLAKEIADRIQGSAKELMEDPKTAKLIIAFSSLQDKPTQTITTPKDASIGLSNEEIDVQYKAIFSKANISKDKRSQLAKELMHKASDKQYASSKVKGLL